MELIVPVQVRFADVDHYGHINNGVYLTYFEVARLALYRDGSLGDSFEEIAGEGAGIVVAYQEVAYGAPIGKEASVLDIATWVTRVGRTSFDVAYSVRSHGQECAIARTSMVLVDIASGRPRKIDDRAHAILQHFSGAPIDVRARRVGQQAEAS